MFQALDILEPYVAKGPLKKIYRIIVSWPFVIFTSLGKKINCSKIIFLGLSTILCSAFGIFMDNFYKRDDNLCWIRSDYIVSGVILPMCHLSANAVIFLVLLLAITVGSTYEIKDRKKKEENKGS